MDRTPTENSFSWLSSLPSWISEELLHGMFMTAFRIASVAHAFVITFITHHHHHHYVNVAFSLSTMEDAQGYVLDVQTTCLVVVVAVREPAC